MNRKWIYHLVVVLAIVLLITAACASGRNADNAVKGQPAESVQQVGGTIDDASITSAIKVKFAKDNMVSDSNINIDTEGGNVTLTGTVGSQAELDRAMNLARTAYGVSSVHAKLVIVPRRK